MKKTNSCPEDILSHPFIQKHQEKIMGVLQGFDRMRLQGTLRSLYYSSAMVQCLRRAGVSLENFKTFCTGLSQRICEQGRALAREAGRVYEHLRSSELSKEELARGIAQREGIESGLVCVFGAVEPCYTWKLLLTRQGKPCLDRQRRQCLHLYFYSIDPVVGWTYFRLQTWFPFLVQIYVNGREWLCRQLQRADIQFSRDDNAVTHCEDLGQAQAFLNEQLGFAWTEFGQRQLQAYHPLHAEIAQWLLQPQYYWTIAESEYATDVLFQDSAALTELYPAWLHYSMLSFGSRQIIRFLGKSVADSQWNRGAFRGECTANLRARPEGIRVKHWLNHNSIKFYNKANILRLEMTLNNPSDYKTYRTSEQDPSGQKQWRPLRRSVADTRRRAEISRQATQRYLAGLAAVDQPKPLAAEAAAICRRRRQNGRSYRALNPLNAGDAALLEQIARGEWNLRGFRNRDLRQRLYGRTASKAQAKRQSTKVTRHLALLRVHGLIRKVPKTHRYLLTELGQRLAIALTAARHADVNQLTQMSLAA